MRVLFAVVLSAAALVVLYFRSDEVPLVAFPILIAVWASAVTVTVGSWRR